MFGTFGEDSDIDPALMNGITGVCVCVMILAIGIYMMEESWDKSLVNQKQLC